MPYKGEAMIKKIAVPVLELEKLEQSRLDLYKFLEDKISERDMANLSRITGQMWRVANTKKWE